MQHQNRSPENIRIENRRKTNKETWDSEEWEKEEAKFLAENPTCFYCGDPSEVPHHETDATYGKPEYHNLTDAIPACHICHNGGHKGRHQCPKCRKIRAKREGEVCYVCLGSGDKARVRTNRANKKISRNRLTRSGYDKAHPTKKVVSKGRWVRIPRK